MRRKLTAMILAIAMIIPMIPVFLALLLFREPLAGWRQVLADVIGFTSVSKVKVKKYVNADKILNMTLCQEVSHYILWRNGYSHIIFYQKSSFDLAL